jgi:nucleoside-diphosphate-sugar epimerase
MGLVTTSYTTITNHLTKTEKLTLTILVTGCSGFIGIHLVNRLIATEGNKNYRIRCMTRNLKSIEGFFDLIKAMTGVDIEFYLIHSMEGSSKDWKKFAERDRIAAKNFAEASTACNVKRITYLG